MTLYFSRAIGLPAHAWMFAAVAGAVLGLAFTLSATTVWFALLMLPLFVWAGRGLGPRERVWVFGLLGVALAARLIALAGFFLSVDHFKTSPGLLIGDELFNKWRSMWLVHLALGERLEAIDFRDNFGSYGQSGSHYILAYWQFWFGPAPYGAHLLNVAIWLTGAVGLHRTARRCFGRLPALAGFTVVLFMPTLFVWSISALKEPAYFFLTAMTIVGAVAVVQARRPSRRLLSVLLVVLAVAAISTLRSIALAVTAGGLVLAAAGWLATRRAWLCVTVCVLVVGGGWLMLRRPPIQARVMHEFRVAAISHIGAVNTPGYGYRLLDPHFYARYDSPRYADNQLTFMVPPEAVRFAIRAALSFFLVPLPWEVVSVPALALLPQQAVWYVLGALAWIGAAAGLRRGSVLSWVLLGNVVLGASAVTLYNGNVGTLVRMRDSVVTVVAWLSALGACVILEALVRRFTKERLNGDA